MSSLPLVEAFCTIQGEGRHAGTPAWFVRLAGCDVGCRWCDAGNTWNARAYPFVETERLVARAAQSGAEVVVVTGGEPLLHPLGELTAGLHARGLRVFLETSGTRPLSGTFDWICLSPKRQKPPLEELLAAADELKIVVESAEDLAWAEENAARVGQKCLLFLQPEWGRRKQVVPLIVDYAKAHPRWKISLQTHKFMDIP